MSDRKYKVGCVQAGADFFNLEGCLQKAEKYIQEAADEGGITKITHVDWSAKNVLGVYGEYTVTVYGE